ncbi:MAG TPA: membrane protein insertase YidC, partial [Hyphomonadaceae bacterium]|nr:membrane protein insertase YidC [Hyphomonadaceae bacterium]HPI49661.1 membrane protein insertase YidC [Hyphomonadaceae bacterium]
MEKEDQRNLILALVLCFGLFMLYNMFVLEPQQKQAQEQAKQAQQNQVTQQASPTPAIRPRADVVQAELAGNQRVVINAPAIDGSILLKGSRIDDVSLKNFYETIQDKEAQRAAGEIKLLSPEGTDRAFYATVAWTTPSSTTDDIVWTQTNTGALTPENPLKLDYTTDTVKIDRTIAIDGDYMFTINDVLTNTGTTPVTLTQQAQMRQRALQEHTT